MNEEVMHLEINKSLLFLYHYNTFIMFGDLMGMMGKLKETQQKIDETKKHLDTVLINEQSQDGMLKVTLTANQKIKTIVVDDQLLADKEQLEDYLILVLNKAIAKATYKKATQKAASQFYSTTKF
jgi:DNA-binding protein YbaB